MMRVRCKVQDSPIHNQGLFAAQSIAAGTVVWSFSTLFDRSINEHVYSHASKPEQVKLFSRGFRNPHAPNVLVLCGDESQFLNFPLPENDPNIVVSGAIDGYDILVAARDIDIGEELLVSPESDYDYLTKVAQYVPAGKDKRD
jgi:SET domain-containing protein